MLGYWVKYITPACYIMCRSWIRIMFYCHCWKMQLKFIIIK